MVINKKLFWGFFIIFMVVFSAYAKECVDLDGEGVGFDFRACLGDKVFVQDANADLVGGRVSAINRITGELIVSYEETTRSSHQAYNDFGKPFIRTIENRTDREATFPRDQVLFTSGCAGNVCVDQKVLTKTMIRNALKSGKTLDYDYYYKVKGVNPYRGQATVFFDWDYDKDGMSKGPWRPISEIIHREGCLDRKICIGNEVVHDGSKGLVVGINHSLDTFLIKKPIPVSDHIVGGKPSFKFQTVPSKTIRYLEGCIHEICVGDKVIPTVYSCDQGPIEVKSINPYSNKLFLSSPEKNQKKIQDIDVKERNNPAPSFYISQDLATTSGCLEGICIRDIVEYESVDGRKKAHVMALNPRNGMIVVSAYIEDQMPEKP